ncbi:MAG: hypothetical protein HY647_07425 [Acidobacteria bacterium]|nr:hypothetical protein [Acidobacteriota bacterium]
MEGVEPPPSRFPTVRARTLVRPDQATVGWPKIPGVKFSGLVNGLSVLDFGRGFDARWESGIITEPPILTKRKYVVLVPKVDTDGNEVDGIRSTTLQAPLGTYAGWNLRRAGFAEDELCSLTGSFIPFHTSRGEREAAGDPRPSLEERYGEHVGYVAAVKKAADNLVKQNLLLEEDVARLIAEAEKSDVLRPRSEQ